MSENPDNIGLRISQFVTLRDKIKEMDDAHKEKMRPYRDALDQLGGVLLDHLKNINSESVRTDYGTVYRSSKPSATIADATAFWNHVVQTEDWDLIDKKANVTAVKDYIEANKQLPPGINFSVTATIGVRRK